MELKKKLKHILLIDDSESDNFYHKRKIMKSGICDDIKITYSGEEALEYLKSTLENGSFPQPTLIFLDINMPGMNGWEFLKFYEELELHHKGEIVLTMLSNSIDPRDVGKADDYDFVNGFYSKPLNNEYLEEIVKEHFPDYIK